MENDQKQVSITGKIFYKLPLNEANLEKLNDRHSQPEYNHAVHVADLDYPCNDKSFGVNNFGEWSYFKRPWHKVLTTHSSTWNRPVLETIKAQAEYSQKIRCWDPADAPKKKRFSRPTFRGKAHLTPVHKKGGKAIGKHGIAAAASHAHTHAPGGGATNVLSNNVKRKVDNNEHNSKVVASDGGGSYSLAGAVAGTKKIAPAVKHNPKHRSKS